MKISLLISSLGPGGAERVMTLLADAFAQRAHQVCLLTLADSEKDFFSVSPQVQRVALAVSGDSQSRWQAIWNNLRRLRAIRRAVCKEAPDVIVSFMTNTNVIAILACALLPVRVIVSERVDPRAHRLQPLWSLLRLLLYRRADVLVVQTQEAATWFRRRMPSKLAVIAIANPLASIGDADGASLQQIPGPFILAVGRLVHQKGFDVLLQAFARVAQRCPSMQLAIAGEGPERESLLGLAASLGIATRVLLLGRVSGVLALMRRAQTFVLSSRYEGFPNVLLEALSIGIPVVATDCPSGPREILLNGKYGLLVPPEDPVAMSEALVRAVTDQELRQHLSNIGPDALRRYDMDNVVDAWERVMSPQRADVTYSGASR